MSTISAGTTTTTALVQTGDTTGALVLQTGASSTTALTLSSAQNATFAGTLATASKGITAASLPAGSVLQVVQGTSTAGDSTGGSTYVATSLSASITPSSASNKIFVLVTSIGTISALNGQGLFTIYRNATNLGAGAESAFSQSYNSNGYVFAALSMAYLDSPATTSATTYAPYIKGNGANTYFGSANIRSTIILMEIAA
jgi:hypothetical protein